MTRLFVFAAVLAVPLTAGAQDVMPQTGDPVLAPAADDLRDDLRHIARVTAAAALAHDATGAFPDTPFALLAGPWATETGLRDLPLSSLTVTASPGRLEITYVPLPTSPYVREDRVVTLAVTPDGGTYRGDYAVARREDPDLGGEPLPYSVAGRYRVERAGGTVCVDAERARALAARGAFEPDPELLSDRPVVVRVRPTGETGPVLYEETAGRPAGR